jgi:predicted nucleic acid-binding protein
VSLKRIHHFSDVENLTKQYPELQNGCLVDTNILIAASIPMDPFNEQAEALIEKMVDLNIPLYTNINIRIEFLEIFRRILVPESLIDFLEDYEKILSETTKAKLKSVQTSYRKSLDTGKVYKFSDDRIKEFRNLLTSESNTQDGWETFCQMYLYPQFVTAWDDVKSQCKLNHLPAGDSENHPLITAPVTWAGAYDIMGNYGLGSADSMILNLLVNSKFKFIITSDGDLKSAISFLREHKKEIISLSTR